MNEKDEIIVKNSGQATILAAATMVDNTLFGGAPLLTTAVALSLGLFGAAAELRTERAVDFVLNIKENPEIFTADVVKTEAFQDAFVYTLEKYIRERNENKRQAIKRIFLGYIGAADPVLFELERLVNMTSVISVEAIEFLKLLHKEVLPRRNRIIEKEGRCFDRLSLFVQKYIDEEYDPNSVKVRERHNYLGDNDELLEHIYSLKSEREQPIRNAEAELLGMGVLKPIVEGGGTLGGGSSTLEYEITRFGEELITFIN